MDHVGGNRYEIGVGRMGQHALGDMRCPGLRAGHEERVLRIMRRGHGGGEDVMPMAWTVVGSGGVARGVPGLVADLHVDVAEHFGPGLGAAEFGADLAARRVRRPAEIFHEQVDLFRMDGARQAVPGIGPDVFAEHVKVVQVELVILGMVPPASC